MAWSIYGKPCIPWDFWSSFLSYYIPCVSTLLAIKNQVRGWSQAAQSIGRAESTSKLVYLSTRVGYNIHPFLLDLRIRCTETGHKWSLGWGNFQPFSAWLLLRKTGPLFSPSLYFPLKFEFTPFHRASFSHPRTNQASPPTGSWMTYLIRNKIYNGFMALGYIHMVKSVIWYFFAVPIS